MQDDFPPEHQSQREQLMSKENLGSTFRWCCVVGVKLGKTFDWCCVWGKFSLAIFWCCFGVYFFSQKWLWGCIVRYFLVGKIVCCGCGRSQNSYHQCLPVGFVINFKSGYPILPQ